MTGKREGLLELLRFCSDSLSTKQGCLGSNVYEAGDEKHTMLYVERWRSATELHRHIQSNLYRGVLAAIDLADGPRDITFYEVSGTKSMELIADLRSPNSNIACASGVGEPAATSEPEAAVSESRSSKRLRADSQEIKQERALGTKYYERW